MELDIYLSNWDSLVLFKKYVSLYSLSEGENNKITEVFENSIFC